VLADCVAFLTVERPPNIHASLESFLKSIELGNPLQAEKRGRKVHSSEEVLATLSPLLDRIVIKALADFEEGRFQVRETIQQK